MTDDCLLDPVQKRIDLRWKVTEQPSVEPVTLEELKTQIRKTDDYEDDYLSSLIIVARQQIEQFLDRALITQTIVAKGDQWYDRLTPILLPGSPVQEITEIQYKANETDSLQTLDADLYQLDAFRIPSIVLPVWTTDVWPTIAHFEIEYVAGYGDTAADVPALIKHAIKMLAGSLYMNRESTSEIPQLEVGTYCSLLTPYRVYR